MNRTDAEEFTQSLGQIVAGSWRQIELAHRLGVHKALGFKSIRDWVNERLGGYVKLSITERIEAAKQLTAESGMSQRETADILGVDQKTVSNDLRFEENSSIASSELANNDDVLEENYSANALEQSRKREKSENSRRRAIEPPDEPNVEDEIDDQDPENLRTAFLLRTDQATRLASDCARLFEHCAAKRPLLASARAAAEAWNKLVETLKERIP